MKKKQNNEYEMKEMLLNKDGQTPQPKMSFQINQKSEISMKIDQLTNQAQAYKEQTNRVISMLKSDMEVLQFNSNDVDFRNKIKNQLTYCSKNFNEIKKIIDELMSFQLNEQSEINKRKQKAEEFIDYVQSQKDLLQRQVKDFKRVEDRQIQSERFSINQTISQSKKNLHDESQQQQQRFQNRIHIQEEMLNDRQNILDDIEQAMNVIEGLFDDAYIEAVKQDKGFQIISSNTTQAKKKGEEANVILQETQQYSEDNYKKTLILAGCIIFFVLIIVLLISAGKKGFGPSDPDSTQDDSNVTPVAAIQTNLRSATQNSFIGFF